MRAPTKRVAYSIAEVVEMTGRDRTTIWRWRQRGVLKAVNIPGGRQMITAASLEKLMQGERA